MDLEEEPQVIINWMNVIDRWLFDGAHRQTVMQTTFEYNACCEDIHMIRLQLVDSLTIRQPMEIERSRRRGLHRRLRELQVLRNHLLDELIIYRVGYHDGPFNEISGDYGIQFTE
jgi:hypothetical protein